MSGLAKRWNLRYLVSSCSCRLELRSCFVTTSAVRNSQRMATEQIYRLLQATAMDRRRVFRVLCSDALRQSFMECDQSKNDPSSFYYVREPDTRVLDMTFPEFDNCIGQWSHRRLCLQVSSKCVHIASCR